jgi:superoxide dismutase, Fe-Mn family
MILQNFGTMAFELPKLPYAYHTLEPYIDTKTMELHHGKHHQAYINNLNKAISGIDLDNKPITAILKNVSQYDVAVRNNGGGHYNHAFFWAILSPQGSDIPLGEMADAICQRFGSFEQFKEAFAIAATTQFGSGWAWLYVTDNGELNICSTPNQDNPLMDVVPTAHRGTPILGLDVWEHAYYLHYQNRRPEYIAAFWHVVNWQEVAKRFQQAL